MGIVSSILPRYWNFENLKVWVYSKFITGLARVAEIQKSKLLRKSEFRYRARFFCQLSGNYLI